VSQSIYRKFLFNNDRLNTGFVFFCVLFLFLVFSAIMIGYGGYVYSSYLKIYKTRTIHDLSYNVGRILADRNIGDDRKPAEISALLEQYRKDPSVSEIWVTDKELLLVASTRADLQRDFLRKKLPNAYYPLYQSSFDVGPSGTSQVIVRDMGKWETGLVVAQRINPKSPFDYSVGIRLQKYNFFLEPYKVNLPGGFVLNVTPILIVLFFLIVSLIVAIVLALLLSSYFDLFSSNVQLFNEHVKKAKAAQDYSIESLRIPEDNSSVFGPLARSLNDFTAHLVQVKDMEALEKMKRAVSDDRTFTHRTLYDALFAGEPVEVMGCETAVFFSGFAEQSRHVLLARERGSFETDFLLANLSPRSFEQFLLTYNLIRDVFVSWKGKESLADLNDFLEKRHLPFVTALAGHFKSTDSELDLWHCGYGSFLIYNSKLDEFVFPSQESLALGKKSREDLLLLMKEQKIRFESGDKLFCFNPELLGPDVSLDLMKKELTGNKPLTAEDILNNVVAQTSAKTKEAFFFLLKKR
jgi:hypothetical protein